MIFLTIGTQGPFDRLVRAVDHWCEQNNKTGDVFGQIAQPKPGAAPKNFEWVDRLDPVEFNARFAAADLIVSHAGMGTIISALQAGKQVVVMPRRVHLGEHRNDHQFATVGQMAKRPGVHVAIDETELGERIDDAIAAANAPNAQQLNEFADPDFTTALRNLIVSKDR